MSNLNKKPVRKVVAGKVDLPSADAKAPIDPDWEDGGESPADFKSASAVSAAGAGALIGAPITKETASKVKTLLRGQKGQRVGLKPLRIRVPYSFSINCAAGGICNGTVSVTADANAAEWAAFLALYDEFRVLGGVVEYGSTYQTPAGANTVDAMFSVLAFDPVDSTALTGVRNGTELSQHHLRMACALSSATNSTAVSMSFPTANSKPHRLRFTLSTVKGLVANNTLVSFAPGQWKSMNAAGSNTPDGYLKFYGTSDNANPVLCVTGVVYIDVEFRSRK